MVQLVLFITLLIALQVSGFDGQSAAESFISLGNHVYNLAGNMSWPEGPVWTGHSLIMSDTIQNTIYEYDPITRRTSPFIYNSGSVSSFISSATNTRKELSSLSHF
jgi:sugar lactone lactonase YvrE